MPWTRGRRVTEVFGPMPLEAKSTGLKRSTESLCLSPSMERFPPLGGGVFIAANVVEEVGVLHTPPVARADTKDDAMASTEEQMQNEDQQMQEEGGSGAERERGQESQGAAKRTWGRDEGAKNSGGAASGREAWEARGESSGRLSEFGRSIDEEIGGWLGESVVSAGHFKMDSPQSMMLSADENAIMRMPNYGSFMHQEENLHALLLDIDEDPQGFTSFVEDRREAFGVLGEATVTALSTGEGSLADYVSLQQVGKGRFSTVYYAETKGTQHPCAIKRIQLAGNRDPAQHQAQGDQGLYFGGGGAKGAGGVRDSAAGRLGGRKGKGHKKKKEMTYEQCLKEVGLLKNLKSPNIVQLYTCFLDQNILWVVMEWVDGGDLKGVLSRTRQAGERLSELAVWGYFTQICDALLHMHGQRIMHRDLKPANVLVGLDGTVKLGDLGLGRYLHARSALAMSQVGTPLYMSPETLQGQGHEMVSDIWSLGCVLYELAMLTSPFAARHLTMDKLFNKIVRADYLPVDRTLYSERLSNLVDHLLMPDPNVRPKIDMVQPASHLALQAQRNGVQGLDVEQLAVCAGEIQREYNVGMAMPGVSWGNLGVSGGGRSVGSPPSAPPIPCNSPRGLAGSGHFAPQHAEQERLMTALEVDEHPDSAAMAAAVAAMAMGVAPRVASGGEGGVRGVGRVQGRSGGGPNDGVGTLPVAGGGVVAAGDWSAPAEIGAIGVGDDLPPLSPESDGALLPEVGRPSGLRTEGRRGCGEGAESGPLRDDDDVSAAAACVGGEEGVDCGFGGVVSSTRATITSSPPPPPLPPLKQQRIADDGSARAAEEAIDGGRGTGNTLVGARGYFVSPPDPGAPVAQEGRDFDNVTAASSGWIQGSSPHAGEKRGLGASALTKSDLGYEAGGLMRAQELGRDGGAQGGGASRPAISVGASTAAAAAVAATAAAMAVVVAGGNVIGDGDGDGGDDLVASFEGLSLQNPTAPPIGDTALS